MFLVDVCKQSLSRHNDLKGGEDMIRTGRQRGQGLVEYALILIFVAVVVVAALMALGPVIGNAFSQVISGL